MKLASIIAASVLGTSLALCATSDADQTSVSHPDAAPTAQTLPQASVPNMTRMPKSYLEATILYRQNGKALFVDTGGSPLPLSQASKPQNATSPTFQFQPLSLGPQKPGTLANPTGSKAQIFTPGQLRMLGQSIPALPQEQIVPDLEISHWLTPIQGSNIYESR